MTSLKIEDFHPRTNKFPQKPFWPVLVCLFCYKLKLSIAFMMLGLLRLFNPYEFHRDFPRLSDPSNNDFIYEQHLKSFTKTSFYSHKLKIVKKNFVKPRVLSNKQLKLNSFDFTWSLNSKSLRPSSKFNRYVHHDRLLIKSNQSQAKYFPIRSLAFSVLRLTAKEISRANFSRWINSEAQWKIVMQKKLSIIKFPHTASARGMKTTFSQA